MATSIISTSYKDGTFSPVSSSKVTTISGSVKQHGKLAVLYMSITLNEAITDTWAHVANISPKPNSNVRIIATPDTLNFTNQHPLRVQADTAGKVQIFYGGSGSYAFEIVYEV